MTHVKCNEIPRKIIPIQLLIWWVHLLQLIFLKCRFNKFVKIICLNRKSSEMYNISNQPKIFIKNNWQHLSKF